MCIVENCSSAVCSFKAPTMITKQVFYDIGLATEHNAVSQQGCVRMPPEKGEFLSTVHTTVDYDT